MVEAHRQFVGAGRKLQAQREPGGTYRHQCADQLALPLLADQSNGQDAFARQTFGVFLQPQRDLVQRFRYAVIVEQTCGQIVFFQRIESEWLFIVAGGVVVRKDHAKALAEEIFDGLPDKACQFAQLETGIGVHVKWRQGCLCRRQQWIGMRCTPFPCIGGQCGPFKITSAEWLQRMFGRQFLQRAIPSGGQIVAQLRHQHRRWLLAVVTDIASDPADVELVACRQQRFQHQITVIMAARAIAGTRHAGQGQQVEIDTRRTARIVGVIESQQAHHAKRNRAHRHERTERDAARDELMGQGRFIDGTEPGFAHHRQRHGFDECGLLAGVEPALQGFVQLHQRQAVALVIGGKKSAQQRTGTFAPYRR